MKKPIRVLKKDRPLICCFYFVSWYSISLGLSIDFQVKNIEIHLPFGFIRVGYDSIWDYYEE